jgi:hypothetical protein
LYIQLIYDTKKKKEEDVGDDKNEDKAEDEKRIRS